MKFLFDFLPLLLFFVTLKLYDIYVATGVAIVASLIQVGAYWFRHRRFEVTHIVTMTIVLVFGGLTLFLHDDTFIKWKPTVVYWIFAMILFGTHFIGERTALEHLLGKQIHLPEEVWTRQNAEWGVFFVALGLLNLYVAFYFFSHYFPTMDMKTQNEYWASFKAFGTTGLTFVFVLFQSFRMAPHMKTVEPEKKEDDAVHD
jgi:intracellular septation protein